ncbi:CHAT domain-containing protein [Sphaerisporangium sp. B11E5]|uniref:CHAT domain-containing protein n=1 Tax=Sphaerisporangium sp. B11E5 TaxID=3153563 RepID=UPI00325ECCC7
MLALAYSRPQEALSAARSLLATLPGAYDASIAHQSIGIVLREFGDLRAAIKEIRRALRLARASGCRDREADVLATLGVALTALGDTSGGLAALDAAVVTGGGVTAARALYRRGYVLRVLGRHHEALADLSRAAVALEAAGDGLWTARALTARALIHLALGATGRADADLLAADSLFAATGQELEAAFGVHNRGLVAFRAGDLPSALDHLDAAGRRYQALDAPMPDLAIDRCAVLLAAGLAREAAESAAEAVRLLDRGKGQATKRAELHLAAARAALAAGDPAAALHHTTVAGRLFTRQQREWWALHARLLARQAGFAAADGVSGRTVRETAALGERLAAAGSPDAVQAYLLAGRMALALGRQDEADRYLATAARSRAAGPPLARAGGWLAEALRAGGGTRRTLAACRRGLDLLDAHRLTFGSVELRAGATLHGTELAAIALRAAARSGRPRALLAWSERWRATALSTPAARPPDDPELRADLAAFREVACLVDAARAGGAAAAVLERERRRLQERIRARLLRLRGDARDGPRRLDPGALLRALGPASLVELAEIDGVLHVLVCGGGRVRHTVAGALAEACQELRFARLGLTRLAYDRASRTRPHELRLLDGAASRLQGLLLGGAVRHLGDGPVVLVPPSSLDGVPWAMLPALRDRVVSVAPSAPAWMRARGTPPPANRDVVLVRGPGLSTGGAEVDRLAAAYGHATVLGDGKATSALVLRAIEGTWLTHIAAHGDFRADSPLFSSLRLDDGPLIAHDLERLGQAPYRLVLPCCDSGRLARAGADELLGLTAALLPLGTAGIISPVVPVNDAATVPLMIALHDALREGLSMPEALHDARRRTSGGPLENVTAWSFAALGAG